MLKVLVVDDEQFIRRGIVNKVNKIVDYCQVVAEAQNGEEAVNMVEQHMPDIVITDIKMPGWTACSSSKNPWSSPRASSSSSSAGTITSITPARR